MATASCMFRTGTVRSQRTVRERSRRFLSNTRRNKLTSFRTKTEECSREGGRDLFRGCEESPTFTPATFIYHGTQYKPHDTEERRHFPPAAGLIGSCIAPPRLVSCNNVGGVVSAKVLLFLPLPFYTLPLYCASYSCDAIQNY